MVEIVSSATSHGQQDTLPLISEEESRLILRRKLYETAVSFERNLRDQLTGVENEVLAEFHTILTTLDDTQDNLTHGISDKLKQEREEVLRKVNNVATYSSILTERLYKELRELLTGLGVWTVDLDDTSRMFNPQQELLTNTHDSSSSTSANNAYRSKRQMVDWDLDSDDHHNLALYEPFEEEELEEVLASFKYMNNLAEPHGDLDEDETQTAWMTSGLVEIPESSQGKSMKFPRDCLDLLELGITQDGVYTIYPTGNHPFRLLLTCRLVRGLCV